MNQRKLLIDPLIAKGALQSGARLDQAKIDAAFRAAMVLLEAGTDMSRMNELWQSYRSFPEYNHWQRVVAWLTAHQ